MLRDADLLRGRTDTEAYMRIVAERYRLLRTEDWSDEVIDRVIGGGRRWRRGR